MILAEIFETLLADRQIALRLSKSQADSLRVSLVRKFSSYKQQLSSLGFLDPSFNGTVLSLEWDKESWIATFYIRAKAVKLLEYELIVSNNGNQTTQA